MPARRIAAALLLLLVGGCPPPPKRPPTATAPPPPRIVVSERGPSGGRLVIVDERGDRLAALTTAAEGTVRDVSPAFSPDGRLIAFASSRDRDFEETSLWVVAARAGSTPVRLTRDAATDLAPAWTADGKALVFSSSRGGGLDLWRVELAADGELVRVDGEPVRLTELPGEELSPSVAGDGRIAFTRVDHDGGVTSARIAVREPDGAITELTRGPADSGPSWTPDGTALAFTAPHLRATEPPGVDGDLWLVSAAGGEPALLVDQPGTDESGAAWSRDGRWVFATSIVRAASTGKPLFSSIVHLDRWEQEPAVRMLVDRAGAVPRLSLAIAAGVLDASALHAGPIYRDELSSILRRALDDE